MNNDFKRVAELYRNYLSKDLDEQQQLEFFSYVQNPAYSKFIETLISESYENPEMIQSLTPEAMNRIFDTVTGKPTTHSKRIKLWPYIAVAIALATIIFGTSLFYYRNVNHKDLNLTAQNHDVAPGKTGATLTLSNGKKIKLSDVANGAVAEEAGVTIKKSENGEVVYEINDGTGKAGRLNTLSTSNGETYKLRLPDGTYVWLNSASSLTYSSKLIENGKRTVRLSGEGYFEVAKDRLHPFVVATDKQKIEVLGTHFNVNSYADEDKVATTLIEGSVSITAGRTKHMIKPGEQAVSIGSEIKVEPVSLDNVVDWKDGDFNLDELDFRIAMRKIARWYNVDIVYEASVPPNIKSGGWISRNRSLSTILNHIESSGQVHFQIKGRTVIVAK